MGVLQQSLQGSHKSEQHDKEAEVGEHQDSLLGEEPGGERKLGEECPRCEDTTDSQEKETTSKEKEVRERTQDSETEVEELRKLWKTHTMQQTKQQRENMQQNSQKEISQKTAAAGDGQLEGESVSMGTVLAFRFTMCLPPAHQNFCWFSFCRTRLYILLLFQWLEVYLSYVLQKSAGKIFLRKLKKRILFYCHFFLINISSIILNHNIFVGEI